MFTFFSEHPMAAVFDFQNGDYFFLKSRNISASSHTRHMILGVYTYIFEAKESSGTTYKVLGTIHVLKNVCIDTKIMCLV